MNDIFVLPQPAPFAVPASYGAGGPPGAVGQNVDSIGLLAAAAGMNTAGADLVRTSGNEVIGQGVDSYAKDSTVDLVAHPKAGFANNTGQKYRIVAEHGLNTRSFYKATDADYFDAVNRTLAYSQSLALSGYGFGKGGPRVFTPAGDYNIGGRTIDITHTLDFGGETTGGPCGVTTNFHWTSAVTGIRGQSYNTTGASGAAVATSYPGAAMAHVHGLGLYGAFSGTESEAHALQMRVKMRLTDLFGDNWPGDFVFGKAAVGSGTWEGNNNDSFIENVFGMRCRRGGYFSGVDMNGALIKHFNANSNRQVGLHLDNIIGLVVEGGDLSSNGQIAGFPTMVTYTGNWFACARGQEAWCSTHAPPATATSNQGWIYISAGYVAPERPTWVSGTTYRAGAPVIVEGNSNFNLIQGLYGETDQGPSQLDECFTLWNCPLAGQPVAVTAGGFNPADPFYGGQFFGNAGFINIPRALRVGTQAINGRVTLAANPDEVIRHEPRDGLPGFQIYYGGGAIIFSDASYQTYFYLDVATGRVAALNAKDAIKVNGTQVIGPRGAALPADATDLASVIALANAIKARLKTTGGHGLVAD